MPDSKITLDDLIENELLKLGVKMRHKGFTFLRESVKRNVGSNYTNTYYREIAEAMGTNYWVVERSIRYALMNVSIDDLGSRQTSKDVIAYITNKVVRKWRDMQ